jgi:hypothetical protein
VAATWPRPARVQRVRTASGEVVRVPVHLGTLELADQPRPLEALIIAIGDEYLLGIQAVRPFRMTFDHGERIIVEP